MAGKTIKKRRIFAYGAGMSALYLSLASGSELAVGLLAGIYCLRRVREFRRMMS